MSTSVPPPRPELLAGTARFYWLAAAGTLCLLGLAFGAQLGGDFVWDDAMLVAKNRSLVEPGGLWTVLTQDLWGSAGQESSQLYHPLPMLSFWVQAHLHGLAMPWLRLFNLSLHGGCVMLLLCLLRRCRVAEGSSLVVAALFAVHPLVTEPVMWLTGRHDTLASLFGLLALLAFPRHDSGRPLRGLVLCGLCTGAAFASKEPYVILPALVAGFSLVERAPRLPLGKLVLRWLAPSSGVLFVFVLRHWLRIPSGSAQLAASPLEHARNYVGIVEHYGVLALSLDQGATIASVAPLSLGSALGLGGALVLLLFLLSRGVSAFAGRTALFGFCWFLLALSPHVVSLPVIGLWGNRYGYFPLLGACLLLGSGLSLIERRGRRLVRRAALGAVAVCVLFCLLQTRLAAASFRDDLTLYRASVDAGPEDGRALYHYAHAVRTRSGCAGAVALLQRATELEPRYARAQRNLAGCWLDLGEPRRALAPAERAVALEPHVASHRYNWGAALLGSGERARGLQQLKQALSLDPGHGPTRRLLARVER